MSTRILGCLSATLLLGACATTPGYHSDRGGDYYYGTGSADVVVDAAPRHSGWGFGAGHAWGAYGGYYAPWAWHGAYGYSPWWVGAGPIIVHPQPARRPVPRDVLRYSPSSNVRADRPYAVPGASAAPRALHAAPLTDPRLAPPPRRSAPPAARVPARTSSIAAPRSSSSPPVARPPVVAPRPAPVFRSAPIEQRAPSAPRSAGKQRSDRR